VLNTAITGLSKSSVVMPAARIMARAGARAFPFNMASLFLLIIYFKKKPALGESGCLKIYV
jgi:hypothetical protein